MSEDLIKRSDAIKALRKLGHEVVVIDKVCSLGVAAEFIDAIRDIPSADRPSGEWIYIDEPIIGNPYGRYKCSKCNREEPFTSDFCPNCGSKMRGEHDD